MGNWTEAHGSYQRAQLSARLVKDWRRMEEAFIFESATYSLQGNISKSFEGLNEALESAVRRGDMQMQVLALTSQTYNAYLYGNIYRFLQKLDKVKDTLRSIDQESYILDMASKINYYGLKSLGCLREGHLAKAFDSASFSLKNITKASPTMFFNFTGYTAVVEVFLLLLQWLYATGGMGKGVSYSYLEKKKWEWEKPATVAKVTAKINKALGCLQKFCDYFEFARARYLLLSGIFDLMLEKGEKAIPTFQEGIEAAKKFEMEYEVNLAYYVFGTSTAKLFDENTKAKYLAEAKEWFKKMEVFHDQILIST